MSEPPARPADPPAQPQPPNSTRDLPRPVLKKMHWPYPLIWVLPLLAAMLAGYYYWQHVRSLGPAIVIHFKDGAGLKAGQTQVTHRGVPVGKIDAIELGPDQEDVRVHVQLLSADSAMARTGSIFWIVRPEISGLSISGLGTVVSGPYIEAIPGAADPATDFIGLERPPQSAGDGLVVILHADHLEHLSPNAGVTYRGIQVGEIQATQLGLDATHVDIYLRIWPRFRNLVHSDTQFWTVSGFDVKGGIFTGISAKLGSLGNIVSGGVAFATPDHSNAAPVETGAEFTLNSEPKKEWDKWAPKISILPEENSESANARNTRQQEQAIKNAVQPHP